MSQWNDTDIRAYLSGALATNRATALEHALAADADLQARMMALDDLAPLVRDSFMHLPDQSRLQNIQDALDTATPDSAGVMGHRSLFYRSVFYGAAAGLLLGALAFGFALPKLAAPPSWSDQVAAYQVLYVPETVDTLNASPADLQAQFDRAGAEIGLGLELDALAGLAGLTLKRAQILGFQGQPLIQIVFATVDGTPVAFCIFKGNSMPTGLSPSATMSGLESVAWASGSGHEFLLIGGSDAGQIEAFSADFHRIFSQS